MLKLTRAASYAVHALVFMANQKTSQPMASHNVAKARGIPERFLLKVLKPLVSARVLLSIKGPNGGYRLAKPANEISLAEVLEAVDGPIRGQNSFFRDGTDSRLNKRLDQICNDTADQVRRQLQKIKIADLAKKR
jgi:Rrf2 family protein